VPAGIGELRRTVEETVKTSYSKIRPGWLPIIFKRSAKVPELPKAEYSENSAKVNPDWVDAPYEVEFRLAPGVVDIGPPPDKLAGN
jgi:hypothetical protein